MDRNLRDTNIYGVEKEATKDTEKERQSIAFEEERFYRGHNRHYQMQQKEPVK